MRTRKLVILLVVVVSACFVLSIQSRRILFNNDMPLGMVTQIGRQGSPNAGMWLGGNSVGLPGTVALNFTTGMMSAFGVFDGQSVADHILCVAPILFILGMFWWLASQPYEVKD